MNECCSAVFFFYNIEIKQTKKKGRIHFVVKTIDDDDHHHYFSFFLNLSNQSTLILLSYTMTEVERAMNIYHTSTSAAAAAETLNGYLKFDGKQK